MIELQFCVLRFLSMPPINNSLIHLHFIHARDKYMVDGRTDKTENIYAHCREALNLLKVADSNFFLRILC